MSVDDDGFSLKPKTVHKDAWFYEGKKGLNVVQVARGSAGSIVTAVEISWAKLVPSFEAYQKYKRRRARKLKSVP